MLCRTTFWISCLFVLSALTLPARAEVPRIELPVSDLAEVLDSIQEAHQTELLIPDTPIQ